MYEHDHCRNTEKYNNVGQNIALFSTKAVAPINFKNVCKGMLDSWKGQAENCNMNIVEQFKSDAGRFDLF